MSKKLAISFAAIAIIAIAGFFYYRRVSSPAYSLLQIKTAYQDHDITLFEKHVDIKTVTNGLLDKSMKEYADNNVPTSNTERLGQTLGKGLANIIRPQMEELWRKQVLALVETGKIGGEDEKLSLDKIWKKSKSIEFKEVKEVSREGKVANIGLVFNHPRFDTTLTLNVLMRDRGSHWQLFDITELFESVKTMDRLEQRRVRTLNAEVEKQLLSNLKPVNTEVRLISHGTYYKYYEGEIKFQVQNTSSKPIKSFKVFFMIRNSKGKLVEPVVIESSKVLDAGQIYTHRSGAYVGESAKDIKGPYSNDISYGLIEFLDGEKIEWAAAWDDVLEENIAL
jgi:hypothetical protein